MNLTFNPHSLYEVKKIEDAYPDIKLLYKIGSDDRADNLYYVPSKKLYFEKGAFGRYDLVCFMFSDVCDEDCANIWKERRARHWKIHHPHEKWDYPDGIATDQANDMQNDATSSTENSNLNLNPKFELFRYYDIKETESSYPDLQLVYSVGTGYLKNTLYYIPSQKLYLEKGVYGYHRKLSFKLSDVCCEHCAKVWEERRIELWKDHKPLVTWDYPYKQHKKEPKD